MAVKTYKTVIGVIIVIGIALSWVSATQFAKSTYSPSFNAPYFTTWFSTAWMVIVFPVYFIPSLFRSRSIEYWLQFFRSVTPCELQCETTYLHDLTHLTLLKEIIGVENQTDFTQLWGRDIMKAVYASHDYNICKIHN